MATKNRTLLEIYREIDNVGTRGNTKLIFGGTSFYKFISDYLGNVLKDIIENSAIANMSRREIEELLNLLVDSKIVEPLEDSFKVSVRTVDPIQILSDKSIVGIDGGAFTIKFHPLRFIIAKSAIFTHTQRFRAQGVRGIWRTAFSIVRKSGNFEELLRRKVREVLVKVESKTTLEVIEEFGDNIDAIFWDGPLYNRRYFDEFYNVVKAARDFSVPIIKLVKNSFSARIAQYLGFDELSDADLFSAFLGSRERSAFFLYKGPMAVDLPIKFRPVFFYVKTSNKLILRYEFPYWVLEEYGSGYIQRIIYADMQLGGGLSYVLMRADNLARFTDQERRRIVYHIISALRKNGLDDVLLFNERRWARFLVM